MVQLFRTRMEEQVLLGRMIGGPRWESHHVTDFFGGRGWYGIPCSAVEKEGAR